MSPWVSIPASQGGGSHKYANCQEVKPGQDSGTTNNLGKTTHWVILQYEDQHVKVNKTPNLIIPDCPEYLLLWLVVFVLWDTKKPINHQRDVNTHLSPYILQTSLKLCTAGFQKYCSQCFARPTLKASQRMLIFFCILVFLKISPDAPCQFGNASILSSAAGTMGLEKLSSPLQYQLACFQLFLPLRNSARFYFLFFWKIYIV